MVKINVNYKILIITAVSFLLLTACSSHKKIVSSQFTYKEEKQIEKEIEKRLKGDELKIIDEAFEWLDTPYKYGAEEKGVATDCSGMVMKVFEKSIGCKLPRNSAKQAEFCESIRETEIKPGDLVFFITNSGDRINHVGIILDDEKFIHASSKGVVVASMRSNYYKTHFKKYGRVPCMKH